MSLFNANKAFDMSQRYEGDIGFGDIYSGSLEQFRMEDKTTSESKMLSPRIGKQVSKAYELAPELFEVDYGERLHPALSFAQQTQDQAAEGAVWNNRSDIYFDNLDELKQRFPDAGFMDMDEIYKDTGQEILAGRESQARKEKHATPMARALGSIAGTAQGAMEDPVNILSMLVFKTPATTLLGKAAFTGGVSAASETAIQPFVYDFKQKAGVDYSLEDALANIGMAGLGGALLEGVGHGISKAYKAAVKRGEIIETPQTKAAVEKIEELQEIVDEVAVEDVSRLDMSTEARMQRARDMGFDAETVYYHGTRRQFDSFMPSQPRGALGNPKGIYFTKDRRVAEEYALDDGADYLDGKSRVVEVYLKDPVEIDAYGGAEYLITDPANIRSVNAAFNPEQAGSAKLIDTPELNTRLQGLAKAEADLMAGRPVQGDESIQAIDEPTAANWDEYQKQNKGSPATFKQEEKPGIVSKVRGLFTKDEPQKPKDEVELDKDEVELDIAEAEALIADDQDLPDIADIDQYGNEVMVPAKVAMTKANREINAIDSLLDCIK